MLDEEEYRRVTSLKAPGIKPADMFAPMLAEYELITGFRETNPNAIFHHRLSLYGPACHFCGKPLRTPAAKLCGNCMKAVLPTWD